MSKAKLDAIKYLKELSRELSATLDADPEVIASMPIEDVEAGLREMGIDPDKPLSLKTAALIAEFERQQAAQTGPGEVRKATARTVNLLTTPARRAVQFITKRVRVEPWVAPS